MKNFKVIIVGIIAATCFLVSIPSCVPVNVSDRGLKVSPSKTAKIITSAIFLTPDIEISDAKLIICKAATIVGSKNQDENLIISAIFNQNWDKDTKKKAIAILNIISIVFEDIHVPKAGKGLEYYDIVSSILAQTCERLEFFQQLEE